MTADQVKASMPAWYWSAVRESAHRAVHAPGTHQKRLWRLFLRFLTRTLEFRVGLLGSGL